MPSVEGRGVARKAWEGYQEGVGKAVETAFGPAIKSFSTGTVADLMGFWLLWQMEGGFEGLRGLGMSRASIFRKVSQFRKVTGTHPDEYQMPGVMLDREAYWSYRASRSGREEVPRNP